MRHRSGTSVGGGPDVRKLAQAIAAPGIDTRFWLSLGIVATVTDAGDVDEASPNAVIVGPPGVEADVVLLPSMDHATCRRPSGGRLAQVDGPLRAGDEVLVAFAEGLPGGGGGPIILAVMNNANERLHLDEADGKPFFRNDRWQVHAGGLPIDLRSGPARIEVRPDGSTVVTGTVLLGGADADQQVIRGNAFINDFMALMLTGAPSLASGVAALKAASSAGPTSGLNAGFTQLGNALTSLATEFAKGNWLSATTKTK